MLSYGFIQFTECNQVLLGFQDFTLGIGASEIFDPDIDAIKGVNQPAEYVAFTNLQNNSFSVSTWKSKSRSEQYASHAAHLALLTLYVRW